MNEVKNNEENNKGSFDMLHRQIIETRQSNEGSVGQATLL
jgi:hypothetical protein